jgi:RHS repeat-associated protein
MDVRSAAWLIIGLLACGSAFGAEWNVQTHDIYAGDFDGDGVRDELLVIAKDPAGFSGIFTSSGGVPSVPLQTWHSGFLGINWHSGNYTAIVGDWNANGQDDVLLQSRVPGNSYVLRVNGEGKLYAIHQVINDSHLTLGGWSQQAHRIVVGNFNGVDGDELFLQSASPSGTNAIVAANAAGNFAGTLQTWNNDHLGFHWSTRNAIVHVGDFNGDQRDDLLVQAKPGVAIIDFDPPFPVPVFKPQMFGLTLATTAGQFTSPHQLWNRKDFEADWSAADYEIVIGDFNGDGRDDVFLVAKRAGKSSYVMLANSNGQFSGAPAQTLSPGTFGTNWTGADYRMITADFNGDGRSEIYRQAVSSSGANSIVSFTSSGTVSAVTGHSAPPITNAMQTAVGHLAGEFNVDVGGAATYSIAIDTPAGLNGLQPSVSLAYNSLAGSGELGVGWSLEGLSEINRCASNLEQDGVTRGVQLSTSDRFCLDGQKLRTTSGTYGAHGTQYRTELDSFARITSYTSGGSGYVPSTGPQYFKVEGKDGLYYFYGLSEESRVQVQGTSVARTWALSRVEDRTGNYLTLTYTKGTNGSGQFDGSYRPTVIEWARTAAGGGPYFSLTFVYENRPAADIDTMYFAGGGITDDKRLKRLEVRAYDNSQWSIVRQYEIGYEASLSSASQSRVESVTQCSATECLPATTFQYQNGEAGWTASDSTTGSNSSALMEYSYAIDINGDGRDDLVYPETVSGTTCWLYMLADASGAYGTPVNTGIVAGDNTNLQYAKAQPIDYFSEGRVGLLVDAPGYSTRQIVRWNGTTLALTNTDLTIALSGKEWLADFDGDGRSDVLYSSNSGSTGYLNVLSNAGATSGTATFSANPPFYSTAAASGTMNPFTGESANWFSKVMDFNGDGLADFLYSVTTAACPPNAPLCNYITTWTVLISTGTSFVTTQTWSCINAGSSCQVVPVTGDFNGDGQTDLISHQGTLSSGSTWRISYGSGLGLGAPATLALPSNFVSSGAFVEDYDDDGRGDLFYAPLASSNWYVLRFNGTSFDAPLALSLPASSSINNTVRTLDFDGDGQRDIGFKNGVWRVRKHNGVTADLLKKATDGFGNVSELQYATLVDPSVYTRGTGSTYPIVDVLVPMHVVKSFTASTGVALPASYSVSYKYESFRANIRGRGFLGFAKRIATDGRQTHEVRVEETFSQQFPYVGMVLNAVTYQPGTSTKMSEVVNEPSVKNLDTTPNNKRYFSYIYKTTETKYEVSSGYSGSPVSRIATTNTYDDYGNLTDQSSTVTDLQSDSELLNSTYTIQTSHIFDFGAHPEMVINWCIGASTGASVRSQTPGLPLSSPRVKSFEYDYPRCRLAKEILEPNNPGGDTMVTTDWEYYLTGPSIGQLWRETVTATAAAPAVTPAPRSTTLEYHPAGPYVTKSMNALGHATGSVWNIGLGVVTQTMDINGISITRQYDSLGRATRELRPDGSQTDYLLYGCSTGCGFPTGKYQVIAEETGGGLWISRSAAVYDQFDREIQSTQWMFGGAQSHVTTEYNHVGRVVKRSAPFWTGTTPYYFTQEYDLLGRPTVAQSLVNESGAQLQTSTTVYRGLRIDQTDAENKTTTAWNNAMGQVVRTIDAANGVTRFAYDQFGNVVSTKDPANNEFAAGYNIRGHRGSTNDPSTGTVTYKHNSFGELVSQVDAKSQSVSVRYDAIGRMTRRNETEGQTDWIWDTATNGKGMLHTVASLGQQKSYSYDGLGRPQTETTTIDGIGYQTTLAYNSQGQLDTLTYPQSYPTGFRAQVRFTYDAGLTRRVQSTNPDNTVYWQAVDTNPGGQVINELFGNGISTFSWYDGVHGGLRQRDAGPSNSVQSLSYQWDHVGNLKQRKDTRGASVLTEDFWYDNLYRLDYSKLNGAAASNLDLSYDAIGNLQSKVSASGTVTFDYTTAQASCSYTFAHAQPYAVRKVGQTSYCYDANGNVERRGSDQITWYSYNLPKRINKGANYSEFFYGADGARYKQLSHTGTGGPLPAGDETTVYVGAFFEVVTRASGVIEYKHHIPGGDGAVAIRTVRSNNSADTRYLHKDHLGGVDVITNESGTVVSRLSNDALGDRRDAGTWSGTPDLNAWNSIATVTHRGFTMHEHLDNVDVVHMNGRVYDPKIGRFLSADPFVQSPTDSQSLNRYSYVMNNPLSATDPSGYFSFRKFFRANIKFHLHPSPRNSFEAIRTLPFQKGIDRYVMTHKWAYNLGMAAATTFTAALGGMGGAVWASYYSYQATGSMTDATITFVTTWAVNYALAGISYGAGGGGSGGGIGGVGGWNQGIAGPITIGFQTTAETTTINLGSSYWADVFRWFNIGIRTAGIMNATGGNSQGAAPAEGAYRNYDQLRATLVDRANRNPRGIIALSPQETGALFEGMYYLTTIERRRGTIMGTAADAGIYAHFSGYDTFIRNSSALKSRVFSINGQTVEAGHLNYIAVGMLAAHYGPNGYQLIFEMVAGHNVCQAVASRCSGSGMRNLKDIGPGTKWAVIGADYYNYRSRQR